MLLITLAGCDGDEITTLTVTPSKIDFAANGGSKTLTVKTSAGSWNVNNTATDWLNVSSSSGTNNASLTLTVDSKTLQARSTTLVFSAGDAKPVEVVVSQAWSEFLYSLTANPSNLSFAQGGESRPVEITTDASEWVISSDATWLQFSRAAGVAGSSIVDMMATRNEGGAERATVITITASNAPTAVTLTSAIKM